MTKNLRRIEPTEHQIQCGIVEWARLTKFDNQYKVGDFLIKQANEGKRSWITGKKMKKEGLTAGVSDLFLAYGYQFTGGYCGLWIEVKTSKGKISKSQQSWIDLMKFSGYCAGVVRSVDDGIQVIKDYLGMR